jgi:hypothetical protein
MAEKIYVIFDGPPEPDGPKFVEVENEWRQSINVGAWQEDVERVLDARQDGRESPFFWRLGPFYAEDPDLVLLTGGDGKLVVNEDLQAAEHKIEQLIAAGDRLTSQTWDGTEENDPDKAWEKAKRL